MRPGLALVLAVLLAGCLSTSVTTDAPASSADMPQATPAPAPELASHPAPTSTASPTPTPDPGALELEAISCNGGVVLHWSPSRHAEFHHYIGLRSPDGEIKPHYPPIAPAVDWGDLYATDPFVTSGFDATVVPSDTTWHYRVIAYDASGRVVSRSSVASGQILPRDELGPLEVEAVGDGVVRLAWQPFGGDPACFSSYRVLRGAPGTAGTLLTSVSDVTRTDLETRSLLPGAAYALRVQAVRTTALGHMVVGETEPLVFAVPGALDE